MRTGVSCPSLEIRPVTDATPNNAGKSWLGNLGVRYLIISGCLTDQCVSSAVRDACDLGYLVTLVPDACATHSQARHDDSIDHIRGYCRQRSTDELVAELGGSEQRGVDTS